MTGMLGPSLANHLWQSTLVAGFAGLVTLALRTNRARARHALWLAASCKFLIPFSLLTAAGGYLTPASAPSFVAPLPFDAIQQVAAMQQVVVPFSAGVAPIVVAGASERSRQRRDVARYSGYG